MFANLANAITKHSKVVIAIWIVLVVCSVPFMMKADSVLEYDLTNMSGSSSESTIGNEIMEENFSNSVGMDEVLVVKYVSAENLTKADELSTKIVDLLNTKYSDKTFTLTRASTYGDSLALYSFKCSDEKFSYNTETGTIRDMVSQAKTDLGAGYDFTTYVTGNSALTYDTMQSSTADVAKIDPLSVALIFILLALFFGALATAVVPPVGFGVAYALAMLALYLFGSFTGVFYLTSTLMMVTMLGAGTDYGVFIITRYREELKKGADHHTALVTAVEWAGESVFTSGLSVIIGFACLAICDFALVRTMGLMLALGIVIALVSALTFVPALVNILGEKTFWPNTVAKYKAADEGTNMGFHAKLCHFFGRYFKWVSKVTRKHAVAIIVAAVIISVPSIYVYATSHSSYDMISVEPDGEAKEGLYVIMDAAGDQKGVLMPTYVVVEFENSVIGKMGVASDGSNSMPYMQWSSYALSQTSTGYSGYVPAIMNITNDITDKNSDIVAMASGLNSWEVLFALGQKQALATLSTYDGAHAVIMAAAIAGGMDQATAKAYADANTPTDATALQAFAQAHIGDAAVVNQINSGLVEKMPSAVKSYIQTYVTAATAYATAKSTTATPTIVLGADTSDGTTVTLANLIDYVLNEGTGLVSDNGKYVSIMIVTNEKPMSDNTMDFISALQDEFHGDNGYDKTYSAVIKDSKICGTNAVMYDISGTVTEQFNVIQIVVIILLLVLLFLILGCYFTPIRALVCIMLSVIWTLALTFTVFQTMLSIPVCWIVPIVLFVVLLGLGMDYDIFITTRVRENKIRGMSNDDAIDAAICSASSTISLCALIMGGTFLTLLVGSSSMLQEFGFALGIGILIDGLFMVTYVGPAAMHLMGDWSWKGPKFLQRKHGDQ